MHFEEWNLIMVHSAQKYIMEVMTNDEESPYD